MSKPKQYMVVCEAHGDSFNQAVSHKQAKEMVKQATAFQRTVGVVGPDPCKFVIKEYRAPRYNFSQAFQFAKEGAVIARDGWNGNGLTVQAQFPDEHSKMGNPYLYIDASALGGKANPWVPSQTDLFADDWYVVEIE